MKWIKASERLPNNNWIGKVKFSDGGIENSKFDDGVFKEIEFMCLSFREQKTLEWLDESSPQEPVKKYPIGGYAPGNYQCKCRECKQVFIGDKRAFQCEPCAEKMASESAPQEPVKDDCTCGPEYTAVCSSCISEPAPSDDLAREVLNSIIIGMPDDDRLKEFIIRAMHKHHSLMLSKVEGVPTILEIKSAKPPGRDSLYNAGHTDGSISMLNHLTPLLAKKEQEVKELKARNLFLDHDVDRLENELRHRPTLASIDIAEIIKQKLIDRGFGSDRLINNRGLIGAVIEEVEQLKAKG